MATTVKKSQAKKRGNPKGTRGVRLTDEQKAKRKALCAEYAACEGRAARSAWLKKHKLTANVVGVWQLRYCQE